MDYRIKVIANERLNENGFRSELDFYKNFCSEFSQDIENCIIAFESGTRDMQLNACQAIRDRFTELDTMREMFNILLESPRIRKDCFAYSGGKCRILTELVCKNNKCSFFKKSKGCSRF